MRTAVCLYALALFGCEAAFDVDKPSKVVYAPIPPSNTPGRSHEPYTAKPRYLASARPLQATTSQPVSNGPCQRRSASCDDRLRGVLAAIDGQLLALQSPPTGVELQALKLSIVQLSPLLAPYPDIAAEREELTGLAETLQTQPEIQQAATRQRMTELTDLIRVQLAAAQ